MEKWTAQRGLSPSGFWERTSFVPFVLDALLPSQSNGINGIPEQVVCCEPVQGFLLFLVLFILALAWLAQWAKVQTPTKPHGPTIKPRQHQQMQTCFVDRFVLLGRIDDREEGTYTIESSCLSPNVIELADPTEIGFQGLAALLKAVGVR
uniref:Uncharacterized protein n=1 Tax=Anopheles culicifacies TaxID=139723 RepID=A0A182MAQ1_9DIPT